MIQGESPLPPLLAGVGRANDTSNVGNADNVYGLHGGHTFEQNNGGDAPTERSNIALTKACE